MNPFDIFRASVSGFTPRTPNAALKAYDAGILPIELFVYKSGSTKSLDEEPYDIEEIERLLARKNLGVDASLMLIGIFERLIESKDQEIALFAAESINVIEQRYNKRIQAVNKTLFTLAEDETGGETEAAALSELARLFFELSLLNEKRASIRTFYLKESFSFFRRLADLRESTPAELNTMFRVLVGLRQFEQAGSFLQRFRDSNPVLHLLLKAELEFVRGNYAAVHALCVELLPHTERLADHERRFVDYWLGE
jgi:hypothetical protein